MGKTKVLEKLYYGNINESERLLGKIAKTEEYKQYQEISEKFIATLSQEQETLLRNFSLLLAVIILFPCKELTPTA